MNNKRIIFLIEMLKNGNNEYFNEFYMLTKSAVFYIIKKLVNNNIFIEDIMQETYISFLNNLFKLNANQNPISYLLTITKNKTIDYLRKNSKIENNIDIEKFQEDNSINNFTEFPLLNICKEKLTNNEYKILELTIILGYKRIEVAKILNEPVSTINWKYNKILKKVKLFYKEVYNEKN